MTTPTHDLAIARAERDAWQSTCEELHRTIAGRDVEIEAHLGRCEAADQRARSLEAGLAHVNGNITECRAELRAIRDLVAPGNPQGTVVDAVRAMATGLIESIGARDAAEQARDMARDSRDAAIARAEAAERTLSGLYDDSKAELAKLRAELAELTVTRDRLLAREHEDGRLHAQLRVELAELRARPVLTYVALSNAWRKAVDTVGNGCGVSDIMSALGSANVLPSPDRAEELVSAWRGICTDSATCDLDPAERMRRALASLGAPPTSPPAARPVFAGVSEDELIRLFYVVGTDGIDHGEQCPPIDISDRNGIRAVLARLEVSLVTPVAPTLVAVSDEELATAYSVAHDQPIPRMAPLRDRTIAGIRAVRAKLGAAEVTEERLREAIREERHVSSFVAEDTAKGVLARLRATAAKGG